MTENMVRTQVYLPRHIYDQIKARAEREGITMAHQIREALVEYVTGSQENEDQIPILTAENPIWDIIGMCKEGPEDGSSNHDQFIYTRDWDPESNNS